MFRQRKGLLELEEAFRRLRGWYGPQPLVVVMDHLHQTHDQPRFRRLLRDLSIQAAWTPTEASWLNLIEAQFGVLKRFTLAHTDDRRHAERRRRIYHRRGQGPPLSLPTVHAVKASAGGRTQRYGVPTTEQRYT